MQKIDTIKVTRKGQVTIPIKFREKTGLEMGDMVNFMYEEKEPYKLTLEVIPDLKELKGAFKSKKKYSKEAARKVFIKDIIARKI